MLCLEHSTNSMGEICTNRCPERPTCHQHRIPFLIEAVDRLADEVYSSELNGLFTIDYETYCLSPEAYINGVIDAAPYTC